MVGWWCCGCWKYGLRVCKVGSADGVLIDGRADVIDLAAWA